MSHFATINAIIVNARGLRDAAETLRRYHDALTDADQRRLEARIGPDWWADPYAIQGLVSRDMKIDP